MNWSATEVAALAGKAARGAGAPPAQAERFGQVAAFHLLSGKDPAALKAALEALPYGPILICPRALDHALAKAGHGGKPILSDVSGEPLLSSYVACLPYSARLDADPHGGLYLHVDLTSPRQKAPPGRISGCSDFMAQMTRLADRTFVPESEKSRHSGAGAGLSDND